MIPTVENSEVSSELQKLKIRKRINNLRKSHNSVKLRKTDKIRETLFALSGYCKHMERDHEPLVQL
jgi:hypothetical protein